MADIQKIHLKHGYYFSPGYYRDFWINKIENVFPEEIKNKNVKLKPYREVWVGAIIAAGHTKLTGIKHYVGLPPDEPPDVNILKLTNETMPSGREGTRAEVLRVEITRCSLADNEELINQIRRKNTLAYKGMTLAIYLFGGGETIRMEDLKALIMELPEIYLEEIMIIGKVEGMLGQELPEGTFAQIFLYPELAQTTFNINDESLFFRRPDVLTVKGRGISNEMRPTGTFRLLAPEIKY
jgi:hypothetical protein